MTSPRITGLHWGRVEVGELGSFRDAKLWPGGARTWDWNETGTRHEPGIQLADVDELLDHGARVLVLSQGQQQRLQVPRGTVDELSSRGLRVEVLPTRRAVDRYNELVLDGEAVGALVHSTC